MKHEILIMAAFASVAGLAGCSERAAETAERQEEEVMLTVTVPCMLTKTSGAPSGEDAVNDLQILVFDSKGKLETYKHGKGNSLSMTCTSGEKRIAAFVNSGSLTSVGSTVDLASAVTDLEDNASGGLVMSGETSVVLTASSNVSINVKRVAARVGISKIENAMELEQHRNMSFEIKAVYMINVAGRKAFFSYSEPDLWYNKEAYESGSPAFLYDSVGARKVVAGSAYTGSHYFYCYPNHTGTDVSGGAWCARKTRLVVEVALDGTTYYYPVTLDDVESNTVYSYELKITRPGSQSPDEPVEGTAAGITVRVENWVELPSVLETI